MLAFRVPILPDVALALVGSARERAEYNRAREELRGEVASSIPTGELPKFKNARLEVVAMVCPGLRARDGRYRPPSAHGMHDTIDPIYEALVDAGVIFWKRNVTCETVRVVKVDTHEEEGLLVVISEIEEAA